MRSFKCFFITSFPFVYFFVFANKFIYIKAEKIGVNTENEKSKKRYLANSRGRSQVFSSLLLLDFLRVSENRICNFILNKSMQYRIKCGMTKFIYKP